MKNRKTILIVDDDDAHRTMLRTLVGGWGYDIVEANDGSTAIEKVQERPFDLILMDIRMLKVSGLQALERIKAFNPAIPVTIMTAYSSVETAVEALKKGAYDYLTKPLDFDKLRLTIERAMEHTRLKEENRLLKESLGKHFDMQNIIGRSPAMISLLETVAHVAPSEATVMITGESGTGKEFIITAREKTVLLLKLIVPPLLKRFLNQNFLGMKKGLLQALTAEKKGVFIRRTRAAFSLTK
jgi:two-component system response regulator HydG